MGASEQYNGQALAMRFFQDDVAFCDELDIAIVEGDCPGSSYFAAELRIRVKEANKRAEVIGIPIRFAWRST